MTAALRESAKPPFGADGKLYVAVFGQRDVTVLGTGGEVATRFQTQGLLPTNVAFALRGMRRIHVTEYEFGQVEVFETPADGLVLWAGLKASSPVVA